MKRAVTNHEKSYKGSLLLLLDLFWQSMKVLEKKHLWKAPTFLQNFDETLKVISLKVSKLITPSLVELIRKFFTFRASWVMYSHFSWLGISLEIIYFDHCRSKIEESRESSRFFICHPFSISKSVLVFKLKIGCLQSSQIETKLYSHFARTPCMLLSEAIYVR